MAAVLKSFMVQVNHFFPPYHSKLLLQIGKCAWMGGKFGLKPHLPHSQPHILLYTIVRESRLFLAKYSDTPLRGFGSIFCQGLVRLTISSQFVFNMIYFTTHFYLDDGDVKALLPSDGNVQYHGKPLRYANSLVALVE